MLDLGRTSWHAMLILWVSSTIEVKFMLSLGEKV
jgi:hypothetical protein